MERFGKKMVTEGKHWPEDYKKTALNMIKTSPLGKTIWYTDAFQKLDVDTIANKFGPLSHKNSNLGYFSPIIRWFTEFAGHNRNKYQEFLDTKLDEIIQTLLYISNNPGEESKIKDELKTKWTFDDFEKFQEEVQNKIDAQQQEKFKNLSLQDKGYEIVPIDSYEELHKKFGGDKTGYKGKSEWCHSNGESTYDSWTDNGTKMFFVLAKKNWENIKPPDPKTTNAYDEYGTSLIAILVQVHGNKFLNATLRWNHIIEPSKTKPGASVDKAFIGWGDLAEITGRDVEHEIAKLNKEKEKEAVERGERANNLAKSILSVGWTKLGIDTFKPGIKKNITEIDIPDTVKTIGKNTFSGCVNLRSVNIPTSVKSIEDAAFYNCHELTDITLPPNIKKIKHSTFGNCSSIKYIEIPNNVTAIEDGAFAYCVSLESIEIPDTVEKLGIYVFSGCENLKSIKLPNQLIKIPQGAFSHNIDLKSIEIPNSVTIIGSYAFSNCKSLETVTIPESVKKISESAFTECTEIKSIVIPESVEQIGTFAFGSFNPEKNSKLQSIVIKGSSTKIEVGAFRGCSPNVVVTVNSNFNRKYLLKAGLPKTAKFRIVD